MQQEHSVPEITATELHERLKQGAAITLIDVREPFEWTIANLEQHGARLIPLASFVDEAAALNPADEIVVYCRSGARSARAVEYLHQIGFPRVSNLAGGIIAWRQEIDPHLTAY